MFLLVMMSVHKLLRITKDIEISGSQLVDWLTKYKQTSREDATELGNKLIKNGFVQHCVDTEKPFLDGYYFYLFTVRHSHILQI